MRLRAGWPGSLGLVVLLPLGHFSSSLNKWIAARRPPTHHIQHVISLPIFWCFFFTKRERYTPGELQRFTVMRVSDSNDEVYKHTHTHQPRQQAKREWPRPVQIGRETESFWWRINQRNFFSRVFYTHGHFGYFFFP